MLEQDLYSQRYRFLKAKESIIGYTLKKIINKCHIKIFSPTNYILSETNENILSSKSLSRYSYIKVKVDIVTLK